MTTGDIWMIGCSAFILGWWLGFVTAMLANETTEPPSKKEDTCQ